MKRNPRLDENARRLNKRFSGISSDFSGVNIGNVGKSAEALKMIQGRKGSVQKQCLDLYILLRLSSSVEFSIMLFENIKASKYSDFEF